MMNFLEAIAEADHLRGDLQVKEGDLSKLKIDAEQKWRETSQLRSEVTQARRELENTRGKVDHLQAELDKKRADAEKARSEAETSKIKMDGLQGTLKAKDDEIAFLRGHLSQISEKLPKALQPGEEEAKRKGWWQFWK